MGKKELKEQLEYFQKINEVLTIKISFLILGEEKYKKARYSEGVEEKIINKEIETIKEELENAKKLLIDKYFSG